MIPPSLDPFQVQLWLDMLKRLYEALVALFT